MENPEPTEEENEQVGSQRHRDEEDMRGAGESDADTPSADDNEE